MNNRIMQKSYDIIIPDTDIIESCIQDITNNQMLSFKNGSPNSNKTKIILPVATQRYYWKDGIFHSFDITNNAGIACYTCELLCRPDTERVLSHKIRSQWTKIILNQILDAAVEYEGYSLWCWEARPVRHDYKYPPDWDDICKAIDAIRSYERYFMKKVSITLPNRNQILSLLQQTIYSTNKVGEDIKLNCKNTTALFMFIANPKDKQNNTEDIMVTAVTVRSILVNFSSLVDSDLEILHSLTKRLVEVAEIGLEKRIPFSFLSRCYFSWGLYLLMLLDIGKHFQDKLEIIEMLGLKYIRNKLFTETLPSNLYPYLIQDELNYAKLVSMRIGRIACRYYNKEFVKCPNICEVMEHQIMYQHRRLGHFYGSPVWSSILTAYIYSLEKELPRYD